MCRTTFIGPARLTILQWSAAELASATQAFHHSAGLLEGGLIILALFVFITALINRNSTYVLFAAWLVVNLRMASLSAGWDQHWLGYTIPHEGLSQGRLLTLTLYYVLTLVLFTTLFKEELNQLGHRRLIQVARWSCIPLLLLSTLLSYAHYLPLLWMATGLGVVMLVYLLVRILHKTRSRVAMWYGASLAFTLFASLYEVVSASLGLRGLIGAINSVTAALASSLLASLAIAAQMKQEHDARVAMQAKLQHTYEAMPIGLFTLDLAGQLMSANPALLTTLGASTLEEAVEAWGAFFPPAEWQRLQHLVSTQSDAEMEMEVLTDTPVHLNLSRAYLVKATLAHDRVEGSLQDVTDKSQTTKHLQFLASNDPLTKVLNRRGIEKILDAAMAEATEEHPLALAYLDLDRFKLINDLFGHSAGDEVLQQVCGRVRALLSKTMSLGRVGGDEFVIVMPDTSLTLAHAICQGLVTSIGQTPYKVGSRAFHVRGSIGLIEVSGGSSTKDAVSTADRACHEAKSGNSNGLVVFGKGARVFLEHEAELRLVEQLSAHSDIRGLFLEMQPIMSLTAPHSSLNFEVLLRMRDPNGERISTDRLIAAGESSGRMGMIDRWVLASTLSWLSSNQNRLSHTQFVCMNLSGASLNDERFTQEVFVLLENHLDVAHYLCLEITESVALHDLENTRRFIDRVRYYGARVALDDFGAGYTSFSYLKDLPSDLLKIDGNFIVNMNEHPANIAIVEAIVNLARNLGMKTVAEWAEDAATVQTLTDIGVDYVQGYVISPALMPDVLLQAPSSASFIQDTALQALAHQIQSRLTPQTDGILSTARNLH
ncbi:MAG: putative bifunctional diguanylate cyclase/phosphodiesterase [Leptothrix ochracea]|uniref:putative bifunctional diguanylate cyclase/phosphodiesterase n=1 Tax=Leptothrix ochracea TaxID=735331 RepID=UPI0034E2A058